MLIPMTRLRSVIVAEVRLVLEGGSRAILADQLRQLAGDLDDGKPLDRELAAKAILKLEAMMDDERMGWERT